MNGTPRALGADVPGRHRFLGRQLVVQPGEGGGRWPNGASPGRVDELRYFRTVLVERSGKVEVEGTAIDRDGSGDRLNFWTTDLGQTHLPALIDSLAAIEERFPSSANPEYDCVE